MNNHAKLWVFWVFIMLKKFFHVTWDDYPGPKLGILLHK